MFEETRFNSVESFLDELQPRRWSAGNVLVTWLFRGHGNADWTLLPCAHREPQWEELFRELVVYWARRKRDTFRSRRPISDEQESRFLWVGGVRAAQVTLVAMFVQQLEQFGDPIPDRDRFGRWFKDYLDTADLADDSELDYVEAVGVARHHGITTNLLDWTTRAQVAAFFAAKACLSERSKGQPVRDLCVWALKRNWSDLSSVGESDKNSHMLAVHSGVGAANPYARAQGGYFTRDHEATRRYIKTGEWVGIEKWLDLPPSLFRKLVLPAALADKLMRELYFDDVSAASLMPVRDSVAEDTKRVVGWNKDWLKPERKTNDQQGSISL